MSDTENTPCKRARLDTGLEYNSAEAADSTVMTETAIAETCPTKEQPKVVYNSLYNAPDGDICIIRVEDTHFKIHRYLLSRDSLFFRDMLSLPQTGELQGVSEAAPIVLHDKVEEFCTLCWALYALPNELNAQLKVDADIERLGVLATIANKYQFLSIEDWVIAVLVHHCRQHSAIDKLPLDKTPRYLKIASRSSSKEFQDLVENVIIKKMEKSGIDWNPILSPVEEYGSRRLKGMMFYRILMWQDNRLPKPQPNTLAVHATIWNDSSSKRAYTTYRGYFALTKWWEHFLNTERASTALPRASSCSRNTHTSICQEIWPAKFQFFITETDKVKPKLDILAKLSILRKMATPENGQDTASIGLVSALSSPCIAQWALRIGYLRQELVNTMSDHFYGPLPAQAGPASATN